MLDLTDKTNAALAVVGLLVVLYGCYLRAFPKPLKGIPYNEAATKNLFGDVPSLLKEMKTRGDFYLWLLEQNRNAKSVISQLFLRPFGGPVVLLADARESRDIQLNRTKEFDRSSMIREIFIPLTGETQFTHRTGPKWKLHRRLTQDTMTPNFLREVAAPSIYASCLRFVDLWNAKAQLADGRPFSAEMDLFYVALDAVLAFTFGSDFPHNATRSQVEGMQNLPAGYVKNLSLGPNDAVKFPKFDVGDDISSVLGLVKTMESIVGTAAPRLSWLLAKLSPSWRRMDKTKNELLRQEITKAVAKLAQQTESKGEPSAHNGVDLMVNKEAKLAQRENRRPDFFSAMMMSELYGLLVAGHDTTSSTMCWTMKYLSKYRECQTLLRQHLHSAFAAAVSEDRQPSAKEITGATIPYLDAMIEEIFRFGSVVPMNSREAMEDIELLGHHIPKGTVVMYLNNGPSFTMPSYEVDENKRSPQSKQDGKDARYKSWNENDITEFKPERWLFEKSPDQEGKGGGLAFDPNAGPVNAFGLGPRACFGRRLAYIEFRLLLTMLIWNFELLECPEELQDPSGVVGVIYKPRTCYVRLRKVDHAMVSASA